MSVLVEDFTREQIDTGMAFIGVIPHKLIRAAELNKYHPTKTFTGLGWLDRALEQSEILAPVIPINLLSYGGMLAVCLFNLRQSTRDVDVLLPPNIRDSRLYRDEFTRLTEAVADELGYMRDWINDDLRLFVPAEDRQRLLEDSIEQGTAVYEGDNLVIWAGLYDFGLESKLRRMGEMSVDSLAGKEKYDRDKTDAVELLHRIKEGSTRPLDKKWVEGLRRYSFNPPIQSRIVQEVAEGYVLKYGTQGIVELVWDEAKEKHKYQNLEGEWEWYEADET